jgi:hypothetical protein
MMLAWLAGPSSAECLPLLPQSEQRICTEQVIWVIQGWLILKRQLLSRPKSIHFTIFEDVDKVA